MIPALLIILIIAAVQQRELIANWFWEITWWKVVIATMSLGAFFAFVLIQIFS